MWKWIRRFLVFLLVIVLLIGGVGVAAWQGLIPPGLIPFPLPFVASGPATPDEAMFEQMGPQTVPVRRANTFIRDVQVNGKLGLRTVREIKAPFDEAVATVNVEVGDDVAAGDVLLTLDQQQLSSQLDERWRTLTTARRALADLVAPPTETEIAAAEAQLLAAQEGLTELQEGPDGSAIRAASLSIQEAQTQLAELQARNDPNSQEVRQARFNLRQAELAVQDAQRSYEAIAWRGGEDEAGAGAALQGATISLEQAQIAYDEAIAPPTDLELQQAQLAVARAQSEYNNLFEEATASQIEQARVSVMQAQEALDELEEGPSNQEIQDVEDEVAQALRDFEEVRSDLLTGSQMAAPIDGLVTQIAVVEGQVVEEGDTVAVVAAPQEFEVDLAVNENSILRLEESMPVTMTVDVAPDVVLSGTVTYIGRIDTNSLNSNESSGNNFAASGAQPASYPVTVEVVESEELNDLRAGMNTQVSFVGSNQLPPNSWLVPANSLQNQTGDTATIMVVRGGAMGPPGGSPPGVELPPGGEIPDVQVNGADAITVSGRLTGTESTTVAEEVTEVDVFTPTMSDEMPDEMPGELPPSAPGRAEPEPLVVQVTDITQGEYVVVVSEELQEGDQVVGSVSSFLDQGNPFGGGGVIVN